MSSFIAQPEKECTTPRGHGDGDGIRQNISARKRPPVPSARKFNARTPNDPEVRLKLESALNDMSMPARSVSTPTSHKKCLQKSASVAEITPTTNRPRKRIIKTPNDSFELYATPRCLDKSSIQKKCSNEQFTCALFRRLILLAWRRCRLSKKALEESINNREQQVNQLQMQIDVLSELRNFEGRKREESVTECQALKKSVELLEVENAQLNEENQNQQITVEVLQNEVKMVKSENNFLSDQTLKCRDTVAKMKNEKKLLDDELNRQQQEITSQKEFIVHLESIIQNLQKNLQILESSYQIKEKKCVQLKSDLKNQTEMNNSLSKQLESLQDEKSDISIKIEHLEIELNDYIESCQNLKEINDELTLEMNEIAQELTEEKKMNWLRNTKDFALMSLSTIHKISRVVLPVYFDLY